MEKRIKERTGYKPNAIQKEAEQAEKELVEKMKSMQLEDILTEEQMELYKKATPQRQLWLEWFIRTADCTIAAKHAYPNMKLGSRRCASYNCRQYFKINTAMVFRALGLDENRIYKKVDQLLDAKRVKRTYVKGEITDEIEEEDNFAIAKGLEFATKLTGAEASQKLLIGEDKENPMTSLADGLKTLLNAPPVPQIKEE